MRVTDEIAATFEAAGARGFVHAREIGGRDDGATGADGAGRQVDLDADHLVSAASVIKIVFAVAFARAVHAGRLDPRARVEVPDELRLGGSGTAGFADAPLVSLRDLALLMMTVSDNAATDVIYERVGARAIGAVLSDLKLSNTHVPSDMTTLLTAIWTDTAGPPAACAFVRDVMARQQNTQRLASGFADGAITIAGKTGSIPFVRNEAGVVSYPDGRRYAVAVFTRSDSTASRNPV